MTTDNPIFFVREKKKRTLHKVIVITFSCKMLQTHDINDVYKKRTSKQRLWNDNRICHELWEIFLKIVSRSMSNWWKCNPNVMIQPLLRWDLWIVLCFIICNHDQVEMKQDPIYSDPWPGNWKIKIKFQVRFE